MTDSEIIRNTVRATLEEMGYKPRNGKQYISQNQASKLLTRARVEKGMRNGTVRWTKDDMSNPHCPVRVNREDIYKLINI